MILRIKRKQGQNLEESIELRRKKNGDMKDT